MGCTRAGLTAHRSDQQSKNGSLWRALELHGECHLRRVAKARHQRAPKRTPRNQTTYYGLPIGDSASQPRPPKTNANTRADLSDRSMLPRLAYNFSPRNTGPSFGREYPRCTARPCTYLRTRAVPAAHSQLTWRRWCLKSLPEYPNPKEAHTNSDPMV